MYFPVPPKQEPDEPNTPSTPATSTPVPMPPSGRKMALKCFGLGAIFVAMNIGKLCSSNPSYYPVAFLFGLPMVFAGIVGFVFPQAMLHLAPSETSDPDKGTIPHALSADQLGVPAVLAAGLVGVLIGGYLVYDPEALLRWLGIQ